MYLTDAVRYMGMGQYPKMRFAELLQPREDDDKSAEQLVDEFLAKYEAMGGEE